MTLDITDQERELLVELLAAKNTAMLHELHHTDARDYRELVKQRIEVLEGLRAKVEALPSSATAA